MKKLFIIAVSGILSLGVFSITAFSTPRIRFTTEEDDKLIQLVNQFGNQSWGTISQHMKTRSMRQCKDRYQNYLDPKINNSPWTAAEERLLIQKYEKFGSRWSTIANYFYNRTAISIKYRFIKIKKLDKYFKKLQSYKVGDNNAQTDNTNPVDNTNLVDSTNPSDNTVLTNKPNGETEDFEFDFANNKIDFFKYDHKYDWINDMDFQIKTIYLIK